MSTPGFAIHSQRTDDPTYGDEYVRRLFIKGHATEEELEFLKECLYRNKPVWDQIKAKESFGKMKPRYLECDVWFNSITGGTPDNLLQKSAEDLKIRVLIKSPPRFFINEAHRTELSEKLSEVQENNLKRELHQKTTVTSLMTHYRDRPLTYTNTAKHTQNPESKTAQRIKNH